MRRKKMMDMATGMEASSDLRLLGRAFVHVCVVNIERCGVDGGTGIHVSECFHL